MKNNNKQLGRPEIDYSDTKANIEALTGIVGGETAYATDTGESGHYDAVGAVWVWGGGGGGTVESVTGDGVDNTDPANPVLTFPVASEVAFTPASGIAATDVQAAIVEAKTDATAYADSLVTGLWDDRGIFDASVNAYPSSGGSGTAGAILKGDIWTISVTGTLPTAQVVEIGDTVRALVDTPGNTQANWAITQQNIGYVAENSANKVTTMTGNESSNILYLTVKAIYDWGVATFAPIAKGVTNGDSHDHIDGDGATIIGAKQNLFFHGLNGTVPASSTYYLPLAIQGGLSASAFNIKVGASATLKNLRLTTNGTQPASGSLVVTLQKGNADTAIVITVAAGEAAGEKTDLVHTISVVAGNVIQLTLLNNATAASANITNGSMIMEFS